MAADERLDRIEKKLDTMAEAIVSLARMEERMVTLFKRMDNYDNNQTQMSERLRKIENRVGSNGQMLRFAERLFWIVVAAGVTYIVKS
jgi:tetrahydromethanopterin S-methyltransferase subunit G